MKKFSLNVCAKLFVGSFILIMQVASALTARTCCDDIVSVCDPLLKNGGDRPIHGGYPERMTRTILLKTPYDFNYRLEVDQSESVARFRARLGDVLRTSKFKLMYGDVEVLTDVKAVIGDGADYLVYGDNVHHVVVEG